MKCKEDSIVEVEEKDIIINYKPAKTTKEMVDYLNSSKNVVYNTLSKEEAESILLKYNYINVITPFKHIFARKNEKGEVIKDVNNRHIYDNEIEFSEYFEKYNDERKKYPTIYKNISVFESIFKSIVSYNIVNNKEKIENSQILYNYLESAEIRASLLQEYSEKRKEHILKDLREIKESINNYHDVYCLFDRLSLGHLLSLYTSLDEELKTKVYLEMKKQKMHFGVQSSYQLIDRIFTLVSVRNCVMHNNSLEILVRFYEPKNKSLRKPADRNKFIKMIEELSKEKQLDEQVV